MGKRISVSIQIDIAELDGSLYVQSSNATYRGLCVSLKGLDAITALAMEIVDAERAEYPHRAPGGIEAGDELNRNDPVYIGDDGKLYRVERGGK